MRDAVQSEMIAGAFRQLGAALGRADDQAKRRVMFLLGELVRSPEAAGDLGREADSVLAMAKRRRRTEPPPQTQSMPSTSMNAMAFAKEVVQLFVDTHPRPTQVTIGQAAEMLGIGRWKATQLLKAGTLRLNSCGLIPVEMVDRARGDGAWIKTEPDR